MVKNIMEALINVSEKAANIARVCRQNDHLFSLLIQEKSSDESNSRFVKDFKTLADVLIQETIRLDVARLVSAINMLHNTMVYCITSVCLRLYTAAVYGIACIDCTVKSHSLYTYCIAHTVHDYITKRVNDLAITRARSNSCSMGNVYECDVVCSHFAGGTDVPCIRLLFHLIVLLSVF